MAQERVSEDDREKARLIGEGVAICSAVGRTCMGMGMRMAPIGADPKRVAMSLLEVADQFEAAADATRKLASEICDYDAARLVVATTSGVVLP